MRRSSALALSSVSLTALLLGVASPAYAQVSGPPEVVIPPQNSADAQEEVNEPQVRDADGTEAEGQAIVVTGTRIRLRNLESLEPTVTLDARALRERNFTNVADALNELPGNRGSVTPAAGQGFGQGTNFVNNFGIGSNRTLTLVNGRRFVSSNVASIFTNAGAGTQVDLNVIPAILVDRIDTVSVGGAPVYGSDAIAGTINVILRNKYDGLEASFTNGISEEGDNRNYNLSGDRGRQLLRQPPQPHVRRLARQPQGPRRQRSRIPSSPDRQRDQPDRGAGAALPQPGRDARRPPQPRQRLQQQRRPTRIRRSLWRAGSTFRS